MSMTYSWKVTSITKKDQTNSDGETLKDAIVQTMWEKTGTDADGNVGIFAGATPFTAENTPSGSFVSFEKLTEADVLKWIQSVVTGEYETRVNSEIQKHIDRNINETRLDGDSLPWAS